MSDIQDESVPVRRVRTAREQVAGQLRELIVAGTLTQAQRLPSEAALAAQFGVSRPTVREALRELSALSLVRTSKGACGGSFVTAPTAETVADFLSANIALLSNTDSIPLDDFLDARKALEVPAGRLAAQRRTQRDLDRLRVAIGNEQLDGEDQFRRNKDFHSVLVAASANTLLTICAAPVFLVLQSSLRNAAVLPGEFQDRCKADHRAILLSVEARDGATVAAQLGEHLDYLATHYRNAWQEDARISCPDTEVRAS